MPNLYRHQQRLVELNPNKHLLSWTCGTGKTLAAITIAKSNNQKALVICPKSIVDQWKPQVPTDWLVLSKEQFKKRYKEIGRYDCLIVDEGHYFSNYKSQLTKSLLSYILNYKPSRILLLTATPYLSTMFNLYTYGLILGKNWRWIDFDRKYFYKIKMGRRMISKQRDNLGSEIKKLVNELGDTVSLEECFDVPEQIYQTETFDLTKEQKCAMEEITDFLPIVKFTKISQICGGSLKGDGYTEDKFFKSEKADRAIELAKEHDKIIIVCRYNNEIDYLSSKIKGKEVLIIRGDVKDRHSVCQRAEQSNNCVVLIQASCSEGYELPSFPIMVFYSYDFSLKNYIQMIGRIQRAGHIKKNVYLSLYVKGTIDEKIFQCIMSKRDFDIELYSKQI